MISFSDYILWLKKLTNWLRQLVWEKDSLASSNQRFLEQVVETQNGIRICEQLELFLKRLSAIDKNTEIIPLGWGGEEQWMYQTYKDRVYNAEERKRIVQVNGEVRTEDSGSSDAARNVGV